MVHSDSDLILHNSSVLIDKEPQILISYRKKLEKEQSEIELLNKKEAEKQLN